MSFHRQACEDSEQENPRLLVSLPSCPCAIIGEKSPRAWSAHLEREEYDDDDEEDDGEARARARESERKKSFQ
jgi:hypothetical protein